MMGQWWPYTLFYYNLKQCPWTRPRLNCLSSRVSIIIRWNWFEIFKISKKLVLLRRKSNHNLVKPSSNHLILLIPWFTGKSPQLTHALDLFEITQGCRQNENLLERLVLSWQASLCLFSECEAFSSLFLLYKSSESLLGSVSWSADKLSSRQTLVRNGSLRRSESEGGGVL